MSEQRWFIWLKVVNNWVGNGFMGVAVVEFSLKIFLVDNLQLRWWETRFEINCPLPAVYTIHRCRKDIQITLSRRAVVEVRS